jgi:hypothetical protein
MESSQRRGNPQAVSDGIAAVLDNPRPKLRYVFGRDAKMGLLLRSLLPWSVLEKFLIKASGVDK